MADSQRKTENIYNKYNVINVPNLGTRYGQYVPEDVYSIYNDTDNTVYWGVNDLQSRFKACEPHSTATVDMSVQHGSQNYGFQMAYNDASLGDITIVQGSTAPDHYIPYYPHSLRELKTATETITSGDAIYADGTAATLAIKGNTVQNGTPTPQNPIQPQECGERTGNLVRFYQEEMQDDFYGVDITVKNAEITLNGTVSVGSGHWVEIGYKFGGGTETTDAVVIPCEPETTYTITIEILDGNSSEVRFIAFGAAGENKTVNIGSSLTTVFSGDINRIFISLGAEGVVFNNLKIRVMFNKGSTALPYEPYGYKIPISNGQQTTNIYLGSTQTVRQIKKLVFDGSEGWLMHPTISNLFYIDGYVDGYYNNAEKGFAMSNAFIQREYSSVGALSNGQFVYGIPLGGSGLRLLMKNTAYSTVEDWKTWLAQRYTNGTPVTVYYVLATATTGTVNEPLQKIGTYVDSISGISLPTTDGANTITVDTTVQPSEFTATWTGWHNSTVKEWNGSQWQ